MMIIIVILIIILLILLFVGNFGQWDKSTNDGFGSTNNIICRYDFCR